MSTLMREVEKEFVNYGGIFRVWGGTSTIRWLPGLVLIDQLYFQPVLTNMARGKRETVFLLYSMFRYLRRGHFSHCVREIKTCKVTTGITRFCCPVKVTDKATIFCIQSCRGCAFVNFCRSAGYTRKVLGTRRTSLPAKQHGRRLYVYVARAKRLFHRNLASSSVECTVR